MTDCSTNQSDIDLVVDHLANRGTGQKQATDKGLGQGFPTIVCQLNPIYVNYLPQFPWGESLACWKHLFYSFTDSVDA